MYAKKFLTKKEEDSLKNRLRELRLSKNFNQQQMANELFISRSCWANYESGHRIPNAEMLKTIADYFEVDVNYVMGMENSNRELSELLHRKMHISSYFTKEGHLDISDLSTISKIMLIDFYNYLKIQDERRKKTGKIDISRT